MGVTLDSGLVLYMPREEKRLFIRQNKGGHAQITFCGAVTGGL